MQFHQPISQAIQNVVTAFSNAPVSNPDNSNGIILSALTDEEIPHQDFANLDSLSTIKFDRFGTLTERNSPNAANLLAAKTACISLSSIRTRPATTP